MEKGNKEEEEAVLKPPVLMSADILLQPVLLLPNELWMYIFSFTAVQQGMLEMRLVCKEWSVMVFQIVKEIYVHFEYRHNYHYSSHANQAFDEFIFYKDYDYEQSAHPVISSLEQKEDSQKHQMGQKILSDQKSMFLVENRKSLCNVQTLELIIRCCEKDFGYGGPGKDMKEMDFIFTDFFASIYSSYNTLTNLDMSHNNLRIDLDKIQQIVVLFPHLVTLNLNGNALVDCMNENEVGNKMTQLTSLSLSTMTFDGKILGGTIMKLTNLQTLNMCNCTIRAVHKSTSSRSSLLQGFGLAMQQSLTELNLSNSFGLEDNKFFLNEVTKLTNLTKLDLDFMKLTTLQGIQSNCKLTSLSAIEVNFKQALPPELVELSQFSGKLQKLRISVALGEEDRMEQGLKLMTSITDLTLAAKLQSHFAAIEIPKHVKHIIIF